MVIRGSAMQFQPERINLNKANYISDCMVKKIPCNRREFCKHNYHHIDPTLYDGMYPPCAATDVYSFGMLVNSIRSANIDFRHI